ncbi:unannotated protein [freshwater metagenome]|uniref:Unannotated protein n=1 Tax=freshwater metagenome TaxID=449393 RepID=A0A6J7I0G6_9ZZZZ
MKNARSRVRKSRRGGYATVELIVITPFLIFCAYVTGIIAGGPVGLVIALLAAAVAMWRTASRRVSVDGRVVILHGWGAPRRFRDVVEVITGGSEVGVLGLPVSSVGVILGSGREVELGVLRSFPLSFKFGDEQARRSAAWLAGRLGMVQVNEDTWRLPPPEIL